jgi:hypothetical protein
MDSSEDLLDFVTSLSGDAFLKVEESFGDGFVRLKVSEAERRQAKHDIRSVEDIVVELLRNSRDAHSTRIFLATGREGDRRALTVVDDGVGVPPQMADRIFEPRVTSKLDSMVVDQWGVHGRGMALFSIKSNTVEARIAATETHKGTALVVVADTAQLSERADQSSWPTVERDEEGVLRVARGPHNIARRVVEFSVEHPGVELYVGSPTEIVTTMTTVARRELDASELLFCDDLEKLQLWHRCGAAADAGELVDVAESLGLPISERTAHRILGGELPNVQPVLDIVRRGERRTPAQPDADIYRDRRGLKLDASDIATFRAELERAFDTIASRYYLHLKREPRISIGREDIRVRFEVEKED